MRSISRRKEFGFILHTGFGKGLRRLLAKSNFAVKQSFIRTELLFTQVTPARKNGSSLDSPFQKEMLSGLPIIRIIEKIRKPLCVMSGTKKKAQFSGIIMTKWLISI